MIFTAEEKIKTQNNYIFIPDKILSKYGKKIHFYRKFIDRGRCFGFPNLSYIFDPHPGMELKRQKKCKL